MRTLTGRVVVVTGAGSGIGRALAHAFGRQGCRVVGSDVETAALDGVAAELEHAGIEFLTVATDVSDPDSVDELARRAVERFGSVHILCNNAGVSTRRPLRNQSLADWAWTLGVNLWGPVHGLRSFLPILIAQQEAHVVNTSSVAGLLPFPMGGPYNASKAGVVALTETLFLELAETAPHVGVTLLCPGPTRSAITTAERNRPDRLRNADRPRNSERPESAVSAALTDQNTTSRSMVDNGMAPDAVAETTVRAVRERTFYVLTHRAAYGPSIERRMSNILHQSDPALVPIEEILQALTS